MTAVARAAHAGATRGRAARTAGCAVPAGLVRAHDARAVLLRRLPAGLHAGPGVGLRSVLPPRRPAAGRARARPRLGPQLRGLRRRAACRRRPPRRSDADRRRTRLYLEGVHCAACVWLVEKLPAVLAGVDEVRLNYGSAVAEVTWRPGTHAAVDHRAGRSIASATRRTCTGPRALQEARRVRGSRRARTTRRGRGLRHEPHVRLGRALRRRVLRHGLAVRGVLPLALAARRRPGARLLGATVLPDGAGRSASRRRPHRPARLPWPSPSRRRPAPGTSSRGSGPLWFDSLAMLVAALLGARQLQRSAQRAALERADSLRGVAFLEFARRIDGDRAGCGRRRGAAGGAGARRPRRGPLRASSCRSTASSWPASSSLDNAVLTGEAAAAGRARGRRGERRRHEPRRTARRAGRRGRRAHARRARCSPSCRRRSRASPRCSRRPTRLARRFVQVLLVVAAATAVVGWLQRGPEVALDAGRGACSSCPARARSASRCRSPCRWR